MQYLQKTGGGGSHPRHHFRLRELCALGGLSVNSDSFFRHSTFNIQLSTFPPVTSHDSPVANRCIISPREHPPERSRMPRPALSYRKRDHHFRILSTFAERPRQRLQ